MKWRMQISSDFGEIANWGGGWGLVHDIECEGDVKQLPEVEVVLVKAVEGGFCGPKGRFEEIFLSGQGDIYFVVDDGEVDFFRAVGLLKVKPELQDCCLEVC
jgi:hypothetical protein